MKYTKLLLPAVLTGTKDRPIVENLKHFRRSKITARTGELMDMHLPPGRGGEQALHAATDEILCRTADSREGPRCIPGSSAPKGIFGNPCVM